MHQRYRLAARVTLMIAACTLAILVSIGPSGAVAAPQPSTPGIINGDQVGTDVVAPFTQSEYQRRWPFIVALLDNTLMASSGPTTYWNQQVCGGSLIAPRVVLTAAHCITNESAAGLGLAAADDMDVLIGTTNLNTEVGSMLPSGADLVHVSSIIRHPNYCGGACSFRYDAALLILQREPLDAASKIVRLVDLADAGTWGNGNGVGADYDADSSTFTAPLGDNLGSGAGPWIAGWGDTDPGDGEGQDAYPLDLRAVAIPLQPDTTCETAADQRSGGFSAITMTCGGTLNSAVAPDNNGADSCQGDSGGPLIVWSSNDASPADNPGDETVDDWRLAGLTSWGFGCADALTYGFYTRLGASSIHSFVQDKGIDRAGPPGDQLGDPSNVDAPTSGINFIDLSWDPPATGPTPDHYKVYLHFNGDWVHWTTCAASPCSVRSLHGGATYVFMVTSEKLIGDTTYESYGSAWRQASTLPDVAAPTRPGTPWASKRGRTSLIVRWAPSTDDDAVRRYFLEWRSGGSWKLLARVTSPYLKKTRLRTGTGYRFRVRAQDYSGKLSNYSKAITLYTRR